MLSKTFQYAVVPDHASISDMGEVLMDVGFEPDGDQEYVKEVLNWKAVRAEVKKDEILFSFYWPGSSVTSKYYEYLLHCGMLLEKIRLRLTQCPPKQLESDG